MKTNKILIMCFIPFLLLSACNSWLDIKPTDRQTESMLFSTNEGFYSAVNGVYNKLGSNSLYGENLSYGFLEIAAQRYNISETSNTYYKNLAEFAYSEESVSEKISNIWETAYSTILNINKIIYNIDKQKSILSEKEVEILKGEMLGLRAFIHFDLYRLFVDEDYNDSEDLTLPYNTDYLIKVNDKLSKKDFVENHILKDIIYAEELLKNDIVKSVGGNLQEDDEIDVVNIENFRQIRFNYFALEALKARVYSWIGDKENAIKTAKYLIEEASELFPFVDPSKLLGNSIDPDRIFSSELLFGLFSKNRSNIYEYTFNNEKAGNYLLQPRKNYIENILFNNLTGDYRLQTQWAKTSSSTNQDPVLIKYKKISTENFCFYSTILPLVHLSEMYLIVAESEPDLQNAYNYLNKLRKNRGIIDLDNSGSYDKLKEEIINEYIREYYGEGQIFYIFKKYKIRIKENFNGNGTNVVNFYANSTLPIPESELQSR